MQCLASAPSGLAPASCLAASGPSPDLPGPGLRRHPVAAAAPSKEPAQPPSTVIRPPRWTAAQDFERKHLWSAAIQVYRDAKVKWPSRADFKQRLRLCEMHLRLVRRYGDGSFRNVLLRLPREKALDLFDEMIERIESHYVDPVPLEPLFRRGLR